MKWNKIGHVKASYKVLIFWKNDDFYQNYSTFGGEIFDFFKKTSTGLFLLKIEYFQLLSENEIMKMKSFQRYTYPFYVLKRLSLFWVIIMSQFYV